MNLSDTFLVIVGGGILENSLKLKYKFNNILFTGRLEGDSIKSWYATSQIFVLPSLKEPFGAVINEALIFGNYVICSNIAGASCLINNNNGIVFNPTNEFELEVKLKNYINHIRPIDVLKTLRASKMEYTFDEKFTEFINMI
jgi:glycosyltransferase involved in cell wall biosynthesis